VDEHRVAERCFEIFASQNEMYTVLFEIVPLMGDSASSSHLVRIERFLGFRFIKSYIILTIFQRQEIYFFPSDCTRRSARTLFHRLMKSGNLFQFNIKMITIMIIVSEFF
jgi:hypothetical protein